MNKDDFKFNISLILIFATIIILGLSLIHYPDPDSELCPNCNVKYEYKYTSESHTRWSYITRDVYVCPQCRGFTFKEDHSTYRTYKKEIE